jgi:hypothetical protein
MGDEEGLGLGPVLPVLYKDEVITYASSHEEFLSGFFHCLKTRLSQTVVGEELIVENRSCKDS